MRQPFGRRGESLALQSQWPEDPGAQIQTNLLPSNTEIHGSVTDPSGAVIPAAMVTISSGSFSRTVSTDEVGQYDLTGVVPGHYLAREQTDGSNPGADYIRVAMVQDSATTAEALHRLVEVLS